MDRRMCNNCTGNMYPDGDGWKCSACGVRVNAEGRYYFPKPNMTNADKIRAMSNGVLAQAIMTVSNGYAPWCTHHCEHSGEDECCDCVRIWLQQPAEEA